MIVTRVLAYNGKSLYIMNKEELIDIINDIAAIKEQDTQESVGIDVYA